MRSYRPIVASLGVAAAATAGLSPVVAATAAEAPQVTQYKVSLKISAKEAVAKEDTVKLTGTVVPKPPEDSKVVVQVKYEGKKAWKKVGTATVKPNGNYRFDIEPESHLDRAYRVVKKADDKGLADISRERSLVVSAWSWLTTWTPSAELNVFEIDRMPINGDEYGHSLFVPMAYSTGFTEFTLGRNCYQLEATFGLSDRTATGGKASMFVNADTALIYARNLNLGESDTKLFDVSDVYRLRIDTTQDNATPDTEPSVGAARVRCD